MKSRGGSRGGGGLGGQLSPLWGHLSLKLRKGTELSTEEILCSIVPISLCQVSHHPPFENPGSATEIIILVVSGTKDANITISQFIRTEVNVRRGRDSS